MTNAISVVGALVQPQQLEPAERLQIAWALVWPGALLTVAYYLLRSQLRISAAHLDDVDGVSNVLTFFFFCTWIVRRTVRLDFPGFHLLVVRGDAREGTRIMSYRESLSVTWLISWRLAAIGGVIGMVAGIAFRISGQRPTLDAYNPLVLLSATVAELPILYLWIVKAALNKTYARFSLRIDRPGPTKGVMSFPISNMASRRWTDDPPQPGHFVRIGMLFPMESGVLSAYYAKSSAVRTSRFTGLRSGHSSPRCNAAGIKEQSRGG